jgi:DNA-binding winged helix-turn-helix (wHTH) protein
MPIQLGSRALEILLALVEKPGELVGKRELIARAWPDTVVEESNLRVQTAGLRRALGDGSGDTRYLATISGRGYRFVAPVTLTEEDPILRGPKREGAASDLEAQVVQPVVRVDAIAEVAKKLQGRRVLTVVGRQNAVDVVAVRLSDSDQRDVWLIDLTSLVGVGRAHHR